MDEDPAHADGYRRWADVHIAAGMVSAQLDVTIADAFSWLGAYTAVTQRPLIDVARDIIAWRLRPT